MLETMSMKGTIYPIVTRERHQVWYLAIRLGLSPLSRRYSSPLLLYIPFTKSPTLNFEDLSKLMLYSCFLLGCWLLFWLNVALSMTELMRTWRKPLLTSRERRASSWSTSTASHRTGGWWWRYSLFWWCSSWSSYSSSLDSFCSTILVPHALHRWLLCVVFFNFYLYYYTVYTIFTPDDKQPFTCLWPCKLGEAPALIRYSWVAIFHNMFDMLSPDSLWSCKLGGASALICYSSGDISTICLIYCPQNKPGSIIGCRMFHNRCSSLLDATTVYGFLPRHVLLWLFLRLRCIDFSNLVKYSHTLEFGKFITCRMNVWH